MVIDFEDEDFYASIFPRPTETQEEKEKRPLISELILGINFIPENTWTGISNTDGATIHNDFDTGIEQYASTQLSLKDGATMTGLKATGDATLTIQLVEYVIKDDNWTIIATGNVGDDIKIDSVVVNNEEAVYILQINKFKIDTLLEFVKIDYQ